MNTLLLSYPMNTDSMQKMFAVPITAKKRNLMPEFQVEMILKAKYFKKLQKFHMEKLRHINRFQNPSEPKLTGQLELQLAEIHFQ
jgi:hypothetical protein